MNRIDQVFAELRSRQGRAIIPFICGGHPGPGSTAALLPTLDKAGASVIEVGIPFSDPIADGPVIAAAMHAAIKAGATPIGVFQEVASVRATVAAGLVAMVSVSIVHRLGGPADFARQAAQAGFDGLIVPDSPLEESGGLIEAAAKNGLTLTFMISPTTQFKRAQDIVKACTGFVYLLARGGTTGERDDAPEVGFRVDKLRTITSLPIAVGFGISSADHVRAVVRSADAAIVGSALIRRISGAPASGGDPVEEAARFCRELGAGLPTNPQNTPILPGVVQS